MPDQTPVPDGTLHNVADTGVLPNVPGHPPADDVKSIARELISARSRIAELEEQARTQALGVQLSYALDLWMAMGCPLSEFDGYVERNRIADTWANLLGVVRGLFRPVCGKPTDGGPCVLTAHQIGPCHSRKDVGASEPVPPAEPLPESAPRNPDAYIAVKRYYSAHAGGPKWNTDAEVIPAADLRSDIREWHREHGYDLLPIVGTETGTRPAMAPRSEPDGYAVVVEVDGGRIVQTSALLPKAVAVDRAENYRTEFGMKTSVAELRDVDGESTPPPAPAGYVVVTRNSEGGVHRSATVWESLDQARAAEGVQAGYADGTGCTAAVYALQEVQQ